MPWHEDEFKTPRNTYSMQSDDSQVVQELLAENAELRARLARDCHPIADVECNSPRSTCYYDDE